MIDARQSLTTMDVVHLIDAVKSASSRAKKKSVRQRYAILRKKLEDIGRQDAEAINAWQPHGEIRDE